jgi:hypothetical protein
MRQIRWDGWLAVDVLEKLTTYSKTRVSALSVWMISWSVTMLAWLRSFSSETRTD